MIYFAFQYGNLEMSNLSVVAISFVGLLSIVFFVIASLNTDTKGLIDSAVQKFDADDSIKFTSKAPPPPLCDSQLKFETARI